MSQLRCMQQVVSILQPKQRFNCDFLTMCTRMIFKWGEKIIALKYNIFDICYQNEQLFVILFPAQNKGKMKQDTRIKIITSMFIHIAHNRWLGGAILSIHGRC